MISLSLLLIIAFILPLLLIIKYNNISNYKVIILGFLTFFIPQTIFRIPIINYIYYSHFSITQTLIFKILLPLSAGIVEVSADYIALKFFLDELKKEDAIILGVAHALCENIILILIPILSNIYFLNSLNISYIASFERLFVLILHVSCALFSYYSIKKEKILFLVYAILIHGFADMPILFSNNIFIVELILFLISIFSFIIIIFLIKNDQ